MLLFFYVSDDSGCDPLRLLSMVRYEGYEGPVRRFSTLQERLAEDVLSRGLDLHRRIERKAQKLGALTPRVRTV